MRHAKKNSRYTVPTHRISVNKYIAKLKYCILLSILLSAAIFTAVPAQAENETAVSLDITVTDSNGNSPDKIRDGSYDSKLEYAAGDSITVTAEENIAGIYLIWGYQPCTWTLSGNNTVKTCGKNGYLHEYVPVNGSTDSVTLTFDGSAVICDIYAYSEGTLPDEVQLWKPSCYAADFLVFSTHADDEILFLGGVLATYAGEQQNKVQLVYMTHYWNGARIREHEKLDGLWESGVRYYPVNLPFDDIYAETLEGAESVYSYEDLLGSVTEQIRRFRPMVVVTQDLNGEYGHGGHMILAKAVTEAVENSHDEGFEPDSAALYGTWDVPKTYLHLYSENKLTMDLRVPLENMGGRTAIEVAADAYLKHVSQQWCWFYVSDEYEYSCAEFGLYRSTVGADTGIGDMLENVQTYGEIEEQLRKEEEEAAKSESENANAELTAAAENLAAVSSSDSPSGKTEEKTASGGRTVIKLLFTAVFAVILIGGATVLLFILRARKKTAAGRRRK